MRIFWYLLGWTTLLLGVIGVALPIMPTVPFLLISVWAFARSSPRLRQKIMDHPTYGPPIRAWQERGAINRRAKIWAISAMTGSVGIALWIGLPGWVVAIQAAVCASVGLYLATRPVD